MKGRLRTVSAKVRKCREWGRESRPRRDMRQRPSLRHGAPEPESPSRTFRIRTRVQALMSYLTPLTDRFGRKNGVEEGGVAGHGA